jgi:hypothetical protein
MAHAALKKLTGKGINLTDPNNSTLNRSKTTILKAS